jgi:hypothetical protein
MTDLEGSPVSRRTTVAYKGRRIIVTLRADDQIELRLSGLRKAEIVIPIAYMLEHPEKFSNSSIPARK